MTKKLSHLAILWATLLVFTALPLQIGFAQETPPENEVEIPAEIANMQSEGFTIVPSSPSTPGSSNFEFELGPGSQVRDSVIIQNLSTESATFYLYGADPTFSQQGTRAYKTRNDGGDGEGQWIKFDKPEIVLQGGEQQEAFFTLSIPESTAFAEYRAGIAMEKTKKDANNPSVTIATRLVLHANITIKNIPPVIEEPESNATWQAYYFWISLCLFLVSLAALIWVTFEENKEKSSPKKSAKKRAKKK